MAITTQMISDYVYESSNERGQKVRVDTGDGDAKESLSPTELLLASVSGCVAVDIVLILKKRRKHIDDFRIETSGVRKDDHPRGFTSIHTKYIVTSPDVKKEELDKVATLALEKYCSVADSLRSEIEISSEVIRSA